MYKDGIKAKRPFKSLLYLTAIHEWVWITTYIQKCCPPPPVIFMNPIHSNLYIPHVVSIPHQFYCYSERSKLQVIFFWINVYIHAYLLHTNYINCTLMLWRNQFLWAQITTGLHNNTSQKKISTKKLLRLFISLWARIKINLK